MAKAFSIFLGTLFLFFPSLGKNTLLPENKKDAIGRMNVGGRAKYEVASKLNAGAWVAGEQS